MSRVISVTNQKGGVGKTLTATSLASILTTRGYKVLTIDMDPQCNFDQVAGCPVIQQDDITTPNILHILKQECKIEDAIVETPIGDLVRSTPNLSQWIGRALLSRHDIHEILEKNLSQTDLWEIVMSRYTKGWGNSEHKTLDWEIRNIREKYDFILLDTNPSLTLLTLNSLYTADYVLIPAFPERTSYLAVQELVDTIHVLKDGNAEMHAQLLGILITKYKARTRISRVYANQYKKLADYVQTTLFETKIRDGIVAQEYANKRQDVIRYAGNSPVAQDYQAFTDEFLTRIASLEEHENG